MHARSPLKILGILLLALAGLVLLVEALNEAERTGVHPNPAATIWLPFPDGTAARCIQGPGGVATHQGISAWDFVARAGAQFVAAEGGRVIHVVDDHTETGTNAFNSANRVLIDHGGGRYSVYLHHHPRSALVRPMELVGAGTPLATVGATGTRDTHLHVNVRGPSWHVVHDVAFHTADLSAQRVTCRLNNYAYRSVTPRAPPPAPADSTITGDEFAANGITLAPGPLAFILNADEPRVYRGKARAGAARVGFYVWRDGMTSEYLAHAPVALDGTFELSVRIPIGSRGVRWYRIAAVGADGVVADEATLPAWVR